MFFTDQLNLKILFLMIRTFTGQSFMSRERMVITFFKAYKGKGNEETKKAMKGRWLIFRTVFEYTNDLFCIWKFYPNLLFLDT